MSLGNELGLKDIEIETALSFFSLLNSILWYPKEVTNLVFIDPHSLIEVVNELMVFVCKVRNNIDIGPGTLAGPEMANFGIISSDVFSHTEHLKMYSKISKEVRNFKSDLFKVFDYLLLAKQLSDSEPKYFMPALLPLTDPLEAIPLDFRCNIPLLFYFTNGVPVGLFCAMIVKLLSSEDRISNDDNFLWSLDTKSTPKMYSNCVILRKGDLRGRVCLIESSDWFEIRCERRVDQPKVKEAIEIAIAETKEKRKIEVKFKISFFCPCGKQPSHCTFLKQHSSEHFCQLADPTYGICIQVTKDSSHFSWIFLKSNSGKRPELVRLVELLAPIKSKWHLIGHELGVDVIDDLNKSDDIKLNEVIQKWVETKPTPTTWDNIIKAVKGQSQDIASNIQDYLDQILDEQEQSTVKSCVLDSTPDLHKLLELLAGIKHLWYEIGLELGVPNAELKGLQQEHVDNIVRLSRVLQCWINENKEVTWDSIITALRSEIVGQAKVSQEIESFFLKDKLSSQAHQMSQESLHNSSSVPLSRNEDERPRGLKADVPLRTPSNTSPHIHSASSPHKTEEVSRHDTQTMATQHTKLDNTPESCDKAVRALVLCTDDIVESNIDPPTLARKLFTKEIISENIYMSVRNKSCSDTNVERLETILDNLRSRVKQDVNIFMTFVDILRDDLKQNDLSEKIRSKLK